MASKPPPAIPVVLYADPPTGDDSVPPQIIAARNALRNDRRLEVMFFNPEAPTFVLGARHAALSLSPDAVASLDQRKAMTEAVSGNFFAVLSRHGKRSKNVDAVLYEIAPVPQSWSFLDRDADGLAIDLAAKIEAAGSSDSPSVSPSIPTPAASAPASTPADAAQPVPQTRPMPEQTPAPAPAIVSAPTPLAKPIPSPAQVTPPIPVPPPASLPPAQVVTAPPAPAPPAVKAAPAPDVPKAAPVIVQPVLAPSASPQVAPTISGPGSHCDARGPHRAASCTAGRPEASLACHAGRAAVPADS
jgi:hypothetical protein